MSNRPSDLLFQLIGSLSQSEKGYFKKFTSFHILHEQNIYIRLFDALDRQKVYDEQALFRQGFKPGRLSGLKNYLYSLLMKSLDNYHLHHSPDDTIRKLLSYVEILYNKGLYVHCGKALVKARKLSTANENYRLLLEIIRWERSLIILNRKNLNRVNISKDKLNQEEKETLKKLDNLNTYRGLFNRVDGLIEKIGLASTKTDFKKLKTVIKNPLLRNVELAHCKLAKSHFYNTCSHYYNFLGDVKKKYETDRQFVNFIESSRDDTFFDIKNYITALHNVLVSLIKLRKSAEFNFYLEKLKTIKDDSETVNAQIFEFASLDVLDMCICTGEFSMGVSKAKEIERGLKRYKATIHREAEICIYFNIAFLHFGSGKFHAALQWFNKILNASDIQRFSYLHTYAKVLVLLTHVELNNFDLLSYLIRSFHVPAKESKQEKFYLVEKIIFDFFEERAKMDNPRQHLSNDYKPLKKKLQLLIKSPLEKTILQETKIISWLESKISGRTFADVIKNGTPLRFRNQLDFSSNLVPRN